MTAYATLGREAQEGFYQTSQWFKEDQKVITVKMWGGWGWGGNGTFGKTKDLLKQPPQYHLP